MLQCRSASNDSNAFTIRVDGTSNSNTGTEKLRITSDGKVSISSDGTTDGLLTIKGDSDQVTTPSIRLLDGSDPRDVSITNTSGDFVASVHGNDNAIHGHIKMFESGIFDINNGGASGTNTNRLRIHQDGWCMLNTTTLGSSKTAKELIVSYNNTGIGGGDQGRAGITIRSGQNTSTVTQPGYIFFSDGTSGSNESIGSITYSHNDDDMFFTTGGYERLRIKSDGQLIHTTNKASGYIAEFHQSHADNPGTLLIDSPIDNNLRPSALHLAQAGTVKWVLGQVYSSNSDRAFHICSGTGQANSKLMITTGGDFGTNGVTPTAQSGKVFHLHAGANQQRFHMTNDTTGSGATDGFEIIVEESANVRIRNFEAGDLMFDTGGSNNEAMRLDSSGHMGLGVIPNANWPTNHDFKALQIGTGLAVFGRGSGDEDRGGIAVNYYTDGSSNKYLGNGNANRIYMNDGNIDFNYSSDADQQNAVTNSSGAGAALTFARALRIGSDGQVQVSAPNTSTHFSVGTGSQTATMTILDTTEPSAVGVGGKIIFGSKYYNSSNTMAGAYIGQYKNEGPSNGVGEYRHSLSFGTRNENDGLTERMRIDHTGDILIHRFSTLFGHEGFRFFNNLSGGPQIQVSRSGGQPVLLNRNTSDGQIIEFRRGWGAGGSISVGTNSCTYNTSSDYRLKENVVPISDGIARLKTLKPSRFNWIGDTNSTRDGFLAHEVTAVPEAISGTKDETYTEDSDELNVKSGDPKYQGIDQSKLVPLLTAALQEAVAKIEVLESKVAALESS